MRKVIYEEAMDGITISRLIRNYEFNMPSKHTHDEYEIYYLVRGERSYFIEKQIYHIKQGCLVFINRNTIHMTTQYKDSYHERIVLEMREEPIASLLACTGELQLSDFFQRNQGVIELDAENQQYIMSLLDGIASEMGTKDPGYKMMAMNKLIRLFFFTVRHLKQSDFSASTTSPLHHCHTPEGDRSSVLYFRQLRPGGIPGLCGETVFYEQKLPEPDFQRNYRLYGKRIY